MAVKGGASELMRTVDDDVLIKICKKNEEDGEIIEKMVPLSEGCINHATLQRHFPNADGLTYRDTEGVTRRLKKEGQEWRPPKGGIWKDELQYIVTFPDPNAPPPEETKKKKTCEIF